MSTPNPKALAQLCKEWSFTDAGTAGVLRTMRGPDGTEVTIRKDLQNARDADVAACAAAVHLSVADFLAGPKSSRVKKGLATAPRRAVVEFLARQEGMCVEDKSGRATAQVIEGTGSSGPALNQLLSHMSRDGQIRREINGKRTYKIELIPDGPRVRDLMPLEMVGAVNAHLAPVEPIETEPELPEATVEPGVIDLSPYSPDDIAAALMDRVILTIRDGSQSTHARVLGEVEQRLADAVTYGEKQARLRREAEEKLLAAKDKVRQLERRLRAAERERRQVPAETMDVLVNGAPQFARQRSS